MHVQLPKATVVKMYAAVNWYVHYSCYKHRNSCSLLLTGSKRNWDIYYNRMLSVRGRLLFFDKLT